MHKTSLNTNIFTIFNTHTMLINTTEHIMHSND